MTTAAMHEKDLKIKELHQKLEMVLENDESENLKAEIKQQDEKIKRLENELKAERAKAHDIDHPLKSGEAADDDTWITQMKAEFDHQHEDEIKELKANAEYKRKELIEQHEAVVEELKAHIEAEKQNAIAELTARHNIEIKEAREAAVKDIQSQQKAEELQETAQYKELSQQLKDKGDSLDAATAELAFVRGRLEKSEKEVRQLQEENAQLQITDQQQDQHIQGDSVQPPDEYRQLQEAYDQLREEFHQLKVIADMKKEMAPTISGGFVPSSVDPEEGAVQAEKPLLTQSEEEITERDDSQDNKDEQEHKCFHTALQDVSNRTDTQKVLQLERQLKEMQQESDNLREKLKQTNEHLHELQLENSVKKEPQQEKAFKKLKQDYIKIHSERYELIQKLEARDEELKQLRDQKAGASETHPNVTRSLSADVIPSPDDPKAEVVRLREVVKSKEDKISCLEVQLGSFQDVSTEKKKFQDHSQDQSRIVMELKQLLEQAQEVNQTLSKEIETLKTKLEEQQSALEHEKAYFEDEKHTWKLESDAERDANKQLARTIASLQATVHQKRTPEDHYQQELSDRDLTIEKLKTELNCAQIELLEQKRSSTKQITLLEKKLQCQSSSSSSSTVQQSLLKLEEKRMAIVLEKEQQIAAIDTEKKALITKLIEDVEVTNNHVKQLENQLAKITKEKAAILDDLEEQKLMVTALKEDLNKSRQEAETQYSQQIDLLNSQLTEERSIWLEAESVLQYQLKESNDSLAGYKDKVENLEQTRAELEKIVTDLQSAMMALREEKGGFLQKFEEMVALKEQKIHLEQVVINQKAVITNDQQTIQDSQARAAKLVQEKLGLEERLTLIMKEKEELQCEVEVHKLTAASYSDDFERECRERKEIEIQYTQQIDSLVEEEAKYQNQILTLNHQVDEINGNLATFRNKIVTMEKTISILENDKESADTARQQVIIALELEKKERVSLLDMSKKMHKQASDAIVHLQEQVKWLNKVVLQAPQIRVHNSHDPLQPFVIQEPVQLGPVIASGSYGAVHSSTVGDIRCITKRILDILVGRDGHERVSEKYKLTILSNFQRECTILGTARHPNIVQFMGIHYNRGDRSDLCLIMEQLSTDMRVFLEYCEDRFELPLSTQVSFVSDIASGLQYLHGKSIVHRDLNDRNILLTADLQAKIADLGVSKLHDDRKWFNKLTKAPGAQDYMPPEAVLDNPVYDERIDIFSFGVLSLYIATQKYPTPSQEHVPDRIHHRGEGEIHKRNEWLDLLKAQQQEQDEHPFYELIKQCLLVKEKRPDTTRVVEIVQGMCGAHVCTIEETLNVFAHFHDLLNAKQ